MASIRERIITSLAVPALAAYELVPYMRAMVPAGKPVLMVRVDKITQSPERLTRRVEFAIVLVGHLIDQTGLGDDELDEALEDVLHALDNAVDGVVWQAANRVTYAADPDADGWPAYEVTAVIYTTHQRGT